VVKRMRSNVISNLILAFESTFSIFSDKKSWLEQMDENLNESELRREGW